MSNIKLNKEHYELLLKCIEIADFTEWNEFVGTFTQPKQIIRLRGADLSKKKIKGANFSTPNGESSDLFEVNFEGAVLDGCIFDKAYLFNSIFKDTKIQGCNFTNSKLQEADFSNSEITMTCLYKANINKANLKNAYLLDCDSQETNFRQSDLTGVKIIGSEFMRLPTSSNICGTNFMGAKFDSNTYLFQCQISKETDFRTPSYRQIKYSSGLKQTVEYCNRRHNWMEWYETHNIVKSFLVRLFWICSDYGRSTTRIINVFIGSSLLFALIYFMFPSLIEGLGNGQLLRSIYFSVVTMTTLGFGDMHANANNSISQIILIIHVILGYVLLGALITNLSILFSSDGPAIRLSKLPKNIRRTSFTISDVPPENNQT